MQRRRHADVERGRATIAVAVIVRHCTEGNRALGRQCQYADSNNQNLRKPELVCMSRNDAEQSRSGVL